MRNYFTIAKQCYESIIENIKDFWAYVNEDEFKNEFYYSKTLEEKIKNAEQKALSNQH